MAGITFVPRTGISWEYAPAEMGFCGITCRPRLRDWKAAGVWMALHRVLLERPQDAYQLEWHRAARDRAALVNAAASLDTGQLI